MSNVYFDGTQANGAIHYSGTISGLVKIAGGQLVSWRGKETLATLLDGTSCTMLVGEKHVRPREQGRAIGDGSIFNGDHEWCYARIGGPGWPLIRHVEDTLNWTGRFGSYHPGICQIVLADGSVRALQATINSTILGRITVRNDGLPIPEF